MSARSKARKRALDVLYSAEARAVDVEQVLAERLTDRESVPIGDYALGLVRGIAAHTDHIDALIAEHSIDWTIDRMPAVDRAILRIAVFEMVYADDIDTAVAVNEAVTLATLLSTDSSPRFINGVLAQIAAIAPHVG